MLIRLTRIFPVRTAKEIRNIRCLTPEEADEIRRNPSSGRLSTRREQRNPKETGNEGQGDPKEIGIEDGDGHGVKDDGGVAHGGLGEYWSDVAYGGIEGIDEFGIHLYYGGGCKVC